MLTIDTTELPGFPATIPDVRRFVEAHGLDPLNVWSVIQFDDGEMKTLAGLPDRPMPRFHEFVLDERGQRILDGDGWRKTPRSIPLVVDPADYGLLGSVGVNA